MTYWTRINKAAEVATLRKELTATFPKEAPRVPWRSASYKDYDGVRHFQFWAEVFPFTGDGSVLAELLISPDGRMRFFSDEYDFDVIAGGGPMHARRNPGGTLTQAEVSKAIRALGLTFRKTEHGEYRVSRGRGDEIGAYYTNDLQDALGTATLMAKGR